MVRRAGLTLACDLAAMVWVLAVSSYLIAGRIFTHNLALADLQVEYDWCQVFPELF